MDHKIVVVTGVSMGIGRTTAVAFGKRGWRVVLLAGGQEGLAAAKREVERSVGWQRHWLARRAYEG